VAKAACATAGPLRAPVTKALIVAAGNPLGIAALQDVVASSARFINRQRGSGTRLALERLLQERGIDRAEIKGYYTEEFTHLAVAAAIASGVADAGIGIGIGIEAAARRLKLDFIPLFVEDYYLLGKRETVERTDVEAIVGVTKSDDFAALVKEIPGYDTSNTGELTNVADVIG
jgi:putative molybdopterin biosynthesis protein